MRISTIIVLLALCFSSLLAQQSEAPSSTTAVAWSNDGAYLSIGISEAASYAVTLYDTVLEVQTQRFDVSGEVTGLGWSPSGKYLAARIAIGSGYDLQIWNTTTWESNLINELDGTPGDFSVYWAHASDLIASPKQSAIVIWDPVTQIEVQRVTVLDLNADNIIGMAWSRDDNYIYAALEIGSDNVIVWDLTTGEVTSLIDHNTFPLAFALSPDDRLAAVSDVDGFVTIYDLKTLQAKWRFEVIVNADRRIRDLIWTNNGDSLLGITYDGIIFNWDLGNDQLTNIFAVKESGRNSVRDTALSPFGGRLAVAWAQSYNYLSIDGIPSVETYSSLGKDTMDIIVPAPSLDRLNAIAELCVRDAPSRTRAVTGLTSQPVASLDALPDFVAQVESLPEGAIPAACRADLLAVADALR